MLPDACCVGGTSSCKLRLRSSELCSNIRRTALYNRPPYCPLLTEIQKPEIFLLNMPLMQFFITFLAIQQAFGNPELVPRFLLETFSELRLEFKLDGFGAK